MKYCVLFDIDHYSDKLNGEFDMEDAVDEIRSLYKSWIDQFDPEDSGYDSPEEAWDSMIEEGHAWAVPADKLKAGKWDDDDELWLSGRDLDAIGFVLCDDMDARTYDLHVKKHGFKPIEEKDK